MYDLIIIGSGPGGYVAAIRAAQLGLKVAIVEKESLGGVCLNWGCIPTKSLLKSANVLEYVKNAAQYGIQTHQTQADFGAMIKRSRGVADGMNKGVTYLMSKNKIEVIKGKATILKDQTLQVQTDDTIKYYQAKNIIIATGSRSRSIGALPQDGRQIIGYREALTLEKQPKSMIIVGSGAIGLEFAYFYNALGTEVTVVEALSQIAPLEDEEISRELQKQFTKQGIKVFTDATAELVTKNAAGTIIKINTKNGPFSLTADIVLSAAGVVPNTDNLGLEDLRMELTPQKKIVVNENYQTSIANIYAIGDVINTPALAHVASAEGIACVEHIAGHKVTPINYNNIPNCTYCFPEVASVGLTESQARAKGYSIKVGKFPFSASGKASAAGHKDGFVKLIFDAKYGELLGGHLIGSGVTELVSELVVARDLEVTGPALIKSIHPHPTLSEAIMEAAAAAYGEVIHL